MNKLTGFVGAGVLALASFGLAAKYADKIINPPPTYIRAGKEDGSYNT